MKSAFRPRRPIRPALNSGFRGMKRLGVFLLPPGWDASPSQGYPAALNLPVPICTPGWREALWELSVLPKNTTRCPRPGLEPGPLDPETSALTMRPPCLQHIPNCTWAKFVSADKASPYCRWMSMKAVVLCRGTHPKKKKSGFIGFVITSLVRK